MWAYNNAFVDWCISTYHILLFDFSFSLSLTHHWVLDFFSVRLALSLERQYNYANSSTEVNGLHSALSFSLNINALQFMTIELNQSIHRTVMPSCGKSSTSTSILDKGKTIPAPVDYEGILTMEGASSLHGSHLPSSNSAKISSLSRPLSRWQALPAAKA